MGLFDFLKRKPAPAVPPTAARTPARGGAARAHHYLLTHSALRFMALSKPLEYFATLGSSDAPELVAKLLEKVHQQCKDREPVADFSAKDVKTFPRTLGDGRVCLVVEMPPPRAITECYFTAAVLMKRPDPKHMDADIPVRYFTLEFGFADMPDSTRTVLCEWTADGSHANYGDGPEPTMPAFLQRIETVLKRQESADGAH